MTHARQLLGGITIPQRLLLASAFVYGAVFAGLLAYGRPGAGIGGGFYVAVILAGAATSPMPGALAGALALFLYELAINDRAGLTRGDFDHPSSLTRLAAFVAAGALTGFLARRGRLMLAQSLYVLEELMELAHARIEDVAPEDEPVSHADQVGAART
jgi:hypothetical protein